MTDQELQLALAKMLPDKIKHAKLWDGMRLQDVHSLIWLETGSHILDAEWLHVCWLVEQELYLEEHQKFILELNSRYGKGAAVSASWQKRAEALCKVKGI